MNNLNERRIAYYEKLLLECIEIEKWAESIGIWHFVQNAKARTNEVREILENAK